MDHPPPGHEMLRRWADSGAMALTGLPGRHTGPPAGLIPWLDSIAPTLGISEPLSLLTERAAISGLTPRGDISCGGACRILPCADGHIAVSLPRPEDIEVLPAWLECEPTQGEPWAWIPRVIAQRRTADLIERAVLLQMAVSALGEASDITSVSMTTLGAVEPIASIEDALVIDLGTLWAGPLCGRLLRDAGARVIKVESTRRPDGARRGPADFFDLLNAGKDTVALDLSARDGRRILAALIAGADVVIESSRPRALAQMGIDAMAMVANGGPRAWLSITGYGRHGRSAQRVAFGDDAAVAAGLVGELDGHPVFCGDALADPLAGMTAAASAIDALGSSQRCLIDISMAGVAAACTGPALTVPPGTAVPAPEVPTIEDRARPLGADTARVLAELEITP